MIESPKTDQETTWSSTQRLAASVLLVIYLGIAFLGPLSNPVASDHFSRPLRELVSPVHQSLYQGHGYRFFGPDPGPSHLVHYRVTQNDGTILEGKFPDRENQWPRLLYHRWFMLSETLYEEHAFTPDPESFQQEQKALQEELENVRKAGEYKLLEVLEREISDRKRRYDRTTQRIDSLVSSLESFLGKRYEGSKVELFLQERTLPEPMDTTIGVKLDDERYLSPLMPIGNARKENAESIGPEGRPESEIGSTGQGSAAR